ncbi:MAG TPA: SDR family NAD(P)-dependent oxidoreductase [Actinophytocola sp.]|uniref:SDR family NAD(P)-dependent oxidoreductase n=1 Tax=Actinophytocola sp. TaxID=1872138 RepID=UPI002DB5A3AC|nr:SDR family NAD(P)-dependent oxidoreductase [Actinophytocola sp.]HEU5473484.1 SDR family NAD(P)-dependent oxidoreductase [Actinophytocola sp.]
MRTAVITGANRGIGYAVARQLGARDQRIVLVCRDPARGEDARAALARSGATVELVPGDLGTVATARTAADRIAAACPRIDVLVHNAGIWPTRPVRTADGLEQSFVTNHLAPFLLNHALAPALTATGGRVVQVSAGLAVKGVADPERTPTGADFHRIRTYCDTKLCNLLMVPLFARRWADTGITINAVHPGVIRTGLGDPGGATGLLLKAVKLLWKDTETGARPVLRLATDPGLAGVSGRYFDVDTETPPPGDPEPAQRLWDQALELTGLTRRDVA